jgi:hypothetical protein
MLLNDSIHKLIQPFSIHIDFLCSKCIRYCWMTSKFSSMNACTAVGNDISEVWRWLTSVILDTQEAEIRRIVGGSQQGQIVWKTLSQKNPSQKRADREAQGTGHEFKSHYKKQKKRKEMTFPIGIMLLPWTMNTKEVTAVNKYVT